MYINHVFGHPLLTSLPSLPTHQPTGYDLVHNGRLMTLFSASRYCGLQANKGAFLSMKSDLQPEIQQYYAHAMKARLSVCLSVCQCVLGFWGGWGRGVVDGESVVSRTDGEKNTGPHSKFAD
jgi:hypothetical protein